MKLRTTMLQLIEEWFDCVANDTERRNRKGLIKFFIKLLLDDPRWFENNADPQSLRDLYDVIAPIIDKQSKIAK